jgi:hypothetical protein
LPFLRFSRDKRGYEITCLMHAFRRRGSARPRILYCFRTPPGVRVGRAAIDEEAIRAIEERNPDVEFDWEEILKAQTPPPPEPVRGAGRAGGSERRARDRDREGRREPPRREAATKPAAPAPSAAQPAAPAETAETAVTPERFESVPVVQDALPFTAEPAAPESAVEPIAADQDARETPDPLASPPDAGVDAENGEDAASPAAALGDEPVRPIGRVLSAEDILRLRARIAEILARITERVSDPVRLEELRARAEGLNPDTWVTEGEVRQALEQYEVTYHSLRSVLGGQRRRRRRHGRRESDGAAAPSAGAPATPPADGQSTPGDAEEGERRAVGADDEGSEDGDESAD